MPRKLLLAAFLIGIGSMAHAESDPNWDGSILRKGTVSGVVRGRRTRTRKPELKPRRTHRKKGFRASEIPNPITPHHAEQLIPTQKQKTPLPRAALWGMGAAGVAVMGAGLLLLAAKEAPPKPRVYGWIDPEILAPKNKNPKPPPMRPRENIVPPQYVMPTEITSIGSWKAITFHEQGAINRWTDSFEYELGIESFERWLDANADTLPHVDVELLKDKLRRDA